LVTGEGETCIYRWFIRSRPRIKNHKSQNFITERETWQHWADACLLGSRHFLQHVISRVAEGNNMYEHGGPCRHVSVGDRETNFSM
jgi:hypothetical protein